MSILAVIPSGHPYRALVLPALALLVPSIFIIVLASWWLTLEREAGRLRGSEAAATSLARLRRDLLNQIAADASQLADRAASNQNTNLRTTLVSDAAFFDGAGNLLGPGGPAGQTAASTNTTRLAASLLREGRAALESGQLDKSKQAASALLRCCAAARDEFGVSYAMYASWQLTAIGRREPGESRHAIVRLLRDVVDRGFLDRPADVAGLRELAVQLADVPGASALAAAAEERTARAERRRAFARTSKEWMASFGVGSNSPGVIVRPWPGAGEPAIAALWTSDQSRRGVLVLDRTALEAWVSGWSTEGTPFTFSVGARPADDSPFVAPLFVEAPVLDVVGKGPSADPAADRLRERLFMAAAAAVLALTLLSGGLAARDVVRERRLARTRATFLAGVTHEIKTPITSIRLIAETLQQGRAHPSESSELLGTIVNEAGHLSDLVDNLLSTSRIESGARTYRPRVIALGDAVRSARRRFEYTLAKEGFSLLEHIPDTPIWVQADPEALEQAVLNLLGNAMKYSGDSREIRLDVEADETHAKVCVVDRGVGVPAVERTRIFRSFYRTPSAEHSTTGTGLGLALVRHFTDAHGGTVSVASEPGRGSTFTIALPLAPAPTAVDSIAATDRWPTDATAPTHG